MATKPKTLKLFEAYLGTQWVGWKEDPKITIKLNMKTVTIEMIHDDHGLVKTIIDLDKVPAYTFA